MSEFNKINIMVPSYRRPDMLRKFLDSVLCTTSDLDNVVFTVMLNVDGGDYGKVIMPAHTHVIYEETTEPNLSFYYNEMYEKTNYNSNDTLVSMLGDDMVFKTKGWDRIVLAKANEIQGVGIIHCDDDFCQHGNIPVNLFTSRKFVDAAGDTFMCPEFKRYWIDTIWGEMANYVNASYYLPEVVIKHKHNSGKPKHDDTYNRLEGAGSKELVGGIDASKNRIWPYVQRSVKRLLESGLV